MSSERIRVRVVKPEDPEVHNHTGHLHRSDYLDGIGKIRVLLDAYPEKGWVEFDAGEVVTVSEAGREKI